ncbi:MAG: glycine cleavage system aminomethyltransferase GcvT [Candidatus Bathyarchaeia archaeon]
MVDLTLETPLFRYHSVHSQVIEFAGFKMPLWFEGIVPEVLAVRNASGLFDVSHMGRAFVRGRDAERYLDYLTPSATSRLNPGEAHYTVMCNERGGVVDDMVILRLDADRFLVVFNAANREKDLKWMNRHSKGFNVEIENVSDSVAMIAVQGPKARSILRELSDGGVDDIGRFRCGLLKIAGEPCIASGTGYTGEDGLEIFIPESSVQKPDKALGIWGSILAHGGPHGLKPCGLGARDVLRIEAGMCLYSQELTEEITPYEARIGFVVKLDKGVDFIGRNALEKQKSEGVEKVRIGLKMMEKGVPRRGYPIKSDGKVIGEVTSGTFSPILEAGICMGYVSKEHSKLGSILQVDIRGRTVNAEVVGFPFYDTSRYGWMRVQTRP